MCRCCWVSLSFHIARTDLVKKILRFVCCKNESAECLLFQHCLWGHRYWAKQHCSSLFRFMLWTLVWKSSFSCDYWCCFWCVVSDSLPTHDWLLICYSKVVQSYRVTISRRYVSISCLGGNRFLSLSVVRWKRSGQEYQWRGRKKPHKTSCSSLTSHWKLSQMLALTNTDQ